jgi:electron transport complex protein RnfG
MAAPDAGPLRMIGTLGSAGFCSGLALVGIFLATAPMIERNRAEALQKAIFKVLPGAETKEAFVVREGSLVLFESPDGSLPKEEAVYAGYDANGNRLGFAIPAEGPGFQDTIKLIYGYDPARRRVVGMEILESKETPGLGDKIFKDLDFVGNFANLAIDPEIVVTKKGRTRDNEVDAISGATISSNAVARIINQSNSEWLDRLPGSTPAPAGETVSSVGDTAPDLRSSARKGPG